jgi:hypothetical protein
MDANVNDGRAELLSVRAETTWKQVIDVYRCGILADWYVPLVILLTILLLMPNTRANFQFRLLPLSRRMLQYHHASSCDGLSGYYVMMTSTDARPVLVHPHHVLAYGESRSWATDSNKSISVETEARNFVASWQAISTKFCRSH